MSKRIDELWGQALDKAVPDTYSSLTWTQVEKIKAVFAELIVRECLDIVDDEGCGEGGSIRAINKIKQHFGVEE